MNTQKKGLHLILEALSISAIDFAKTKLDASIKSGDDYMLDVFGGKDIESSSSNAMRQYLNEYAKCIEIYTGFISNGFVYVLDRKNKCVFILYSNVGGYCSLYMHYNPLGYDCIEMKTSTSHLFGEIKNNIYDLSKDESLLINECDNLK